MTHLTRRRLLRHCALLPVATLPVLSGCSRHTGACADPDTLTRGQEQMREARDYVEISPLEDQNCASCRFFRSYSEDGCGHCDIFDGPVNEAGHCASWAG